MLKKIVQFAVEFPGVVAALALLLLGYGIWAARRAPVDVFPEFAPLEVVVQTRAPGFSPRQVEQLVSRPLEAAIQGTPGLRLLRSNSFQGYSVLKAFFRDGTDIHLDRQRVAERMAQAVASLPATVRAPLIAPLTTATSVQLIAGLSSKKLSLRRLRSLVDWQVKPRLLAVPGVAKVVVYGGEKRQFQIRLLPDRMKAYGLGFEDVAAAARRATGVFGAGFLDTPNQRILLRSSGQALTARALAGVVIRRSQGMNVTLGDVAQVEVGSAPRLGAAQVFDRGGWSPDIALEVSGQYGCNTLAVTRGLENAFRSMRPLFRQEGVTLRPALFRPATFIQRAVSTVRDSLLLGGALVALVLFLFLWNFRVSLVSLTAIPLSLLSAVLLLRHFGIGLNTMTLGGLAIAIGEVVDDAIIDIENIHRRLGENWKARRPLSKARVVLASSLEVRGAVVFATFIVVLVFLPVLGMGGVQGRLFAPLAWAYIFSILSSLLVALTVTPALAMLLLKRESHPFEERPAILKLKAAHQSLLAGVERKPAKALGLAALALAAALAALPFLRLTFLPPFNEGHLIVHLNLLPGTSLDESLRVGRRVAGRILTVPEVETVSQQAGQAGEADDTHGTHQSELQVDLRPLEGESTGDVAAKIRAKLAGFPGCTFAIKTPLQERMGEVLSGDTSDVSVKIFGDRLGVLDEKAGEVAALLAGMKGARDVRMASPPGVPELSVTLRPGRVRRLGFQPAEVLRAVRTAYQGSVVGQVFDRDRATDVVAILPPALRGNPARVGDLPLRNADGRWVPLKDLAVLRMGKGRYLIQHENGLRTQAVGCDVTGPLPAFVAGLKEKLAEKVRFPRGTYAVVASSEQARLRATRRILAGALLVLGGITLLLWAAFRGGRNTLLVLCNLPFALAGGVLAAFAGGGSLSLGSLVGFVTLFGITTRNSIMLLSHYQHLVAEEGRDWNLDTALRGARERLLPILMTATVAGLGLLPMVLGSGAPGQEIEGPMAVVILGGLASSTAMNLLLLPALALRYGRFERRAGRMDA